LTEEVIGQLVELGAEVGVAFPTCRVEAEDPAS
jgi:hypothetical protein